MASCTHVQWLTVRQDETNFELQYGNRLHNITKCLPQPSTQYPSVVLFIGNSMKSKALRALYPQSAISTCRKFGIANICIDSTTENEEHPVLIAESVPNYAQAKSRGKQTCHETSNHPVPWPGLEIPRRQEFIDHVQARLLSLFTDVICLFAHDYGGLDAVAETLLTWATIGPASNLEHPIRPRLLIVADISGSHFASEALRLQLKVLSHPWFMNAMRIRRLRERKVEITKEDEYNPKDDVLDTETDIAGQDGGDTDPEASSLEFDSEDTDEVGFFVDSEMELTSDDDFESLNLQKRSIGWLQG